MNPYVNPVFGSLAPENDTNGMMNDLPVFCSTGAYGDCPYCDQCNVCHIDSPAENCSEFYDADLYMYGEVE